MVRAAIDGASASRAVTRAIAEPHLSRIFSTPLHVIAVGKAASAMATAVAGVPNLSLQTILAIGTHRDARMPVQVEWHEAAHPVPDARSVTAAHRALHVASHVLPQETLLLLLSGGASSLMAAPLDGVTLTQKQEVIRTMLRTGADIHALNTVRKHLSAVKGGRLGAACRGMTLTLAVSDVVGDDLSVIGSGPAVPDATTWQDAARALDRFGGATVADAVRQVIARGIDGDLPETPKPGAPALSRSTAYVIASRRHALEAARATAEARGYDVVMFEEAVVGEARDTASAWWDRVEPMLTVEGPLCVLSAGETTVRVTGGGRGGRNQEFVLALVDRVAAVGRDVVVASAGTDGIDGPTDAAGAMIDRTTRQRATARGLDARKLLDDNDSYRFFSVLGDLLHVGRTDTNVGDVQIVLAR